MHLFQTLILGMASVQFLEALYDVEREIDENSISLALDLVIAEEDVRFEVRQSLVNNVHVLLGQRPRWCRPLVFGFQRQNGHISYAERIINEKGMTSRHLESVASYCGDPN